MSMNEGEQNRFLAVYWTRDVGTVREERACGKGKKVGSCNCYQQEDGWCLETHFAL